MEVMLETVGAMPSVTLTAAVCDEVLLPAAGRSAITPEAVKAIVPVSSGAIEAARVRVTTSSLAVPLLIEPGLVLAPPVVKPANIKSAVARVVSSMFSLKVTSTVVDVTV